MGAYRIRPARESDAAFLRGIYAYYIENTEYSYHDQPKTVEEYAETIRSLSKRYPFLVAEDGEGRAAGFASGEPIRPQSGYRHTVELTVYLSPDCPKGQGVGSLLYERLLRCLREQGYYAAWGVIDSENRASLALHRRFGFQEHHRMEEVGFRHGRWLTTVYMKKQLRPAEGTLGEPKPFTEALESYPREEGR